MQARAKEASTKSSCHTVQLAAEDFSVQNNGVYSANVAGDITPSGDTLVALLPGGILLENSFTKLPSEPIDGLAAAPGQCGYQVLLDAVGTNVGYSITGWGKDAMVLTLSSGS